MRVYALILLLGLGIYMRFFNTSSTDREIKAEMRVNRKQCVENLERMNRTLKIEAAGNTTITIDGLAVFFSEHLLPKCPSNGSYSLISEGSERVACCSVHGTVLKEKKEDFSHALENSAYLLKRKCYNNRRALLSIARDYINEHHRETYDVKFEDIKEKLHALGELTTYNCPKTGESYHLQYDAVHSGEHWVEVFCQCHQFDKVKEWYEPAWIKKWIK